MPRQNCPPQQIPVILDRGVQLLVPVESITQKTGHHEVDNPVVVPALARRSCVVSNGMDERLALGSIVAFENYVRKDLYAKRE